MPSQRLQIPTNMLISLYTVKHCDEKSTVRLTVTENPRRLRGVHEYRSGTCLLRGAPRRTLRLRQVPPVIAGGYAVPDEAVFVKRWRTEVVTRDMLVFPHGEGAFLLPGFSLRHTMTRQIERRMK